MKKVISILLASLLALCTFSGCSKDENEDDSAPQVTTHITVDSHYSDADESVMYAYEKLCLSVCNGDTVTNFNTQLLDSVMQLFYTSFPLNALVSEVSVLDDKTGVQITYYNDKQTHLSLVSQFNDKLDDILAECGLGTATPNQFVVNVYSYLAQNFTLSNEYATAYDALVNSKGAASAINQLFEYLLICGNCEASHIVKTSGTVSILSYVGFNSGYYYFDVAAEIKNTNGKALKYFAMDSARLSAYAPGQHCFTDQTNAPPVDDDTYSMLSESTSYELSGNKLSVNCGGDEPYVIEIK